MIQYAVVRGLVCFLVLASSAVVARGATRGGTVAVWWQPPGDVPAAARARSAFADSAARRGAAVVDLSEATRREPSLEPALDAALADYAAFRFTDALAKLDELTRLADARGGGDLDQRRLGEMHLFRGMARLEVGPAAAAWDDLVAAARLDPTRVMDPARFPPRVVAAYRRASAEVAQLPRAPVEVMTPAGASVRLDGRALVPGESVVVGPHFVAVDAPGYEPWAAVVVVNGSGERVRPPLHRYEPPDADRLLAATRSSAPTRILAGALVRSDDGWRFVGRELAVADGKIVSGTARVGDAPMAVAVEGVMARLAPLEMPGAGAAPSHRRWWIWAVAGGVAASLAVVIPVTVVYSRSSPGGLVGGPLEPLR